MVEQRPPFFSIIVPTYNRPAQLAACLESLKRLEYPREDFEVIVVDDGSQTPLHETVALFLNQLNITLLTQPHEGPSKARNNGAKQSRGRFLAFTDDDCMPAPNWLQCLEARFAKTPDHIIGGKTLSAFLHNPYLTASQLLIDYLYTYYDSNHPEARFVASNNLALPSNLFHAVGGFDTSFRRAGGEDRELCARWLRYGFGIIYAPEVLVYHAHALRFYTFFQQHFSYGRGAFQFHQSLNRNTSKHFCIKPLPFFWNMLCYPFLLVKGWRAILLSTLITISQGATVSGFLWEMLRQIIRKNN